MTVKEDSYWKFAEDNMGIFPSKTSFVGGWDTALKALRSMILDAEDEGPLTTKDALRMIQGLLR